MSDLAIAGFLMAFLIGLAIAAPIWGVDSRDGVASDQPSRRDSWLHDREIGSSVGARRSSTVALASVLRMVAHRLDEDTARPLHSGQRLAEAS